MKVLFLDIDGVLNGHEYNAEAESNTLRPDCIKNLSKVLLETSTKVVISSSWRYMISRGAVTFSGFEYLLRTHGLGGIKNKIIDITREDFSVDDKEERGRQIKEWVSAHPEVQKYLVMDDLDLGIRKFEHPFIQPDSKIGLTSEQAEEAIKILGRVPRETSLPK